MVIEMVGAAAVIALLVLTWRRVRLDRQAPKPPREYGVRCRTFGHKPSKIYRRELPVPGKPWAHSHNYRWGRACLRCCAVLESSSSSGERVPR